MLRFLLPLLCLGSCVVSLVSFTAPPSVAPSELFQITIRASYQQGTGVRQDDREAYRWFEKAAEGGNADAMNELGLIYQAGRNHSHLLCLKQWN